MTHHSLPPKMEEEFHESDVVFSDYSSYLDDQNHSQSYKLKLSKKTKNKNKKHKSLMSNNHNYSVPMTIPDSEIRYVNWVETGFYDEVDDYNDDVEVGFEGERLPPHVIVARRINKEMACSFCIEDENGRVLKGRNLCEVRNSILRLTGFLET